MNTYESLSITTRLREEANRFIAGGVVSLNRKVDPFIIFNRGKGSKIYDVQGKNISTIMQPLHLTCLVITMMLSMKR
jgi:glutamate-1-semialdehyde aminotransferase